MNSPYRIYLSLNTRVDDHITQRLRSPFSQQNEIKFQIFRSDVGCATPVCHRWISAIDHNLEETR